MPLPSRQQEEREKEQAGEPEGRAEGDRVEVPQVAPALQLLTQVSEARGPVSSQGHSHECQVGGKRAAPPFIGINGAFLPSQPKASTPLVSCLNLLAGRPYRL